MDVSEKLRKQFERATDVHQQQLRREQEAEERQRQKDEAEAYKAKVMEPINRAMALAESYTNFHLDDDLSDSYTRKYSSNWVDVEPFENGGIVQAKLSKRVRVNWMGGVERGTSPFTTTIDLRIRDQEIDFTSEADEAVAVFCADGWIKFPASVDAISIDSPEWDKMVEFLDTIEAAFSTPESD